MLENVQNVIRRLYKHTDNLTLGYGFNREIEEMAVILSLPKYSMKALKYYINNPSLHHSFASPFT